MMFTLRYDARRANGAVKEVSHTFASFMDAVATARELNGSRRDNQGHDVLGKPVIAED